jgi:4-amino-4-deoxy-L-arabinose transferase-like glycosyltransferase
MSDQDQAKQPSLQEIFTKFVQYRYLGLAIAILYFVILLIVSLLFHKVGDYGVETDFFWTYVPEAKSFISGALMIDNFRGPFYPMVLGIVNLVFDNYFLTGILIGISSAAVVIFLTYVLIRKLFSPMTAFFVVLLLSTNPIFVQYSYSAGTDMIFNMLVTAALYYFFKEKELNYQNLIIAAGFAGLSYLTRYNGVFLLGFVFIILFVNNWNISWLKRIKYSLLFVFAFLLTFTPWGIYCLVKKGSIFYNENFKNIAYEVYGKGTIAWDQFWFEHSSNYSSLFDVIAVNPFKFFVAILENVGGNFWADMNGLMGLYVGVFTILGIIFLLLPKPRINWSSRVTGYYLSNIFFFSLLLFVFYSNRFSLFLIPFYAILAVQPFLAERTVLQRKIPISVGYALVALMVVITLSKSISFNSSRISSGPKDLIELQDWYNKNILPENRGKILAARKPHAAYHLGMQFHLLPMADSYSEILDQLKKHNVDYLYLNSTETGLRREYQPLLYPEKEPPGLKIEIRIKKPSSVLYKVVY